jgi:hypothetical protein
MGRDLGARAAGLVGFEWLLALLGIRGGLCTRSGGVVLVAVVIRRQDTGVGLGWTESLVCKGFNNSGLKAQECAW